MAKTKQISFDYLLEKEGIVLQVNAVANKLGNGELLYDKVKETIKKDLDFASFYENKIDIPCDCFYALVLKDKYEASLKELGCVMTYNSNHSAISIILDMNNGFSIDFKSVIFNNQNILPILDHLDATDIIYNEAVKVAWSEFNS